MPQFVFARDPELERSWPFVHERLVSRPDQVGRREVLMDQDGRPL